MHRILTLARTLNLPLPAAAHADRIARAMGLGGVHRVRITLRRKA
jgi:hypothetical protein